MYKREWAESKLTLTCSWRTKKEQDEMETIGRKRVEKRRGIVDEVAQDECWKSEGGQILWRELHNAVENAVWKFPPTTENWFELMKSLLKILTALIGLILFHFYFH